MKLVLFQSTGTSDVVPGVLTERGVVSIASAVRIGYTPQLTMQGIIDDFDRLRPSLDRLVLDGTPIAVESVRLRAPLPRPGKILACIANYWEHGALEARPLNMFLKNSDAVTVRATRSCCRNSPSRGSSCTKRSSRSSSRARRRT